MRDVVLLLPLLISACFGALAPAVAARLPPRHATWLLSIGGLVAAASGCSVLWLLGLVVIGQQPELAREGHWSAPALRAHSPVSYEIEAAALLGALGLTLTAAVVGARRVLAMRAFRRALGALPTATGELIVVPGRATDAYAVPGRPGRVVVGEGLLRALEPAERRALLAHERAHLGHRHHWHTAAATVAVTINPVLLPLRGAAEAAVERWADEEAATAVGDRRIVASALARAALLGAGGPPGTLAAAATRVPSRVAALLASPPPARRSLAALVGLLLVAGTAAAFIAFKDIEHLFELARRVAPGSS
jgi:Zn-dependent protease with chaperone function